MDEKRGSFSGGIGFVLAAAGSAVGLGNLWRFPYLAAQYGGGIFILVYIILALTFGFSLVMTQIAIGRKTGKSAITGYQMLSKKFKFLGFLETLVPLIILPYYCVIGGWIVKYMIVFLTGNMRSAAADEFFGNYVGQVTEPLVYFLIFLLVTFFVVLGGVQGGIERISKFMMPVLIVITIIISIYTMTIDGAMEGVKYYLLPDFSKFSIKTVCAAMGQLFFSMSIAMGILVSYGSYVKKKVNLVKAVNHIEIFDTVVALLAGLMIIPAVYVFSGEEGLQTGGAGLMFKTLPKVFEQMPMGGLIGALFFILVLLAAITSSISVLEATTSAVMDKWKLTRGKAAFIILVISILLGVPSSLGNGIWSDVLILNMDFLTFFDYLSNSLLMPIVALCLCILVGWVIGTKTIEDEITLNGEKFGRRTLYRVMIKYVSPICLVVILIFYTLAQFGVITV